MRCYHCDEDIGPDDRTEDRYALDASRMGVEVVQVHWECDARAVIGSVGHIRKQCPCYGGTEEDPPGMTKREAAKAALAELRMRQEMGLEG